METYPETGRCRAGREPLETSLVEWKQEGAVIRAKDVAALETSLVEWKPNPPILPKNREASLETSLVEWKHKKQYRYMSAEFDLGNFLSGMETVDAGQSTGTKYPPWKLP